MSTIDAIKMRKVETILSGLTRDEQRHCASFLSTALGITSVVHAPAPAPVAPAPVPAINSVADARQAVRDLEHRQMRQFKRGDLVQFTSRRTGHVVQSRVAKFNDRTIGLENGYRVSPGFLELVNPRPAAPVPTAPARPSAAIPSVPGSGSW